MDGLIQRWSLAVPTTDAIIRTLGRIEEIDPAVHAFVAEPGRRERLAAAPPGAGPLAGIAVGVKDIIRVNGLPTRGGSALPPEVFDGPQAPVVDRLLRAGAIVAGKTVTAEFAVSAPNETRNPDNLEHTPGGSSSGSAAAVAAGMVPLAIGTQTIGSIVRPAAFCGVVGFKPTYGRIPADGVIANAPSFDTVGMFGADVASVALAAAPLCDGWRPVDGDGRLPAIGIPSGPYLDHAEKAALAAFSAQVDILRAAGFAVREVDALGDFDELRRRSFTVNRYELARSHGEWFGRYGELYRAETAAAIREGQQIAATDYEAALRHRERFADNVAQAMAEHHVDLWITPAAPGPAPRGLGSTGDPIMSMPWSYARLPSISVPAGRLDDLPLGLQCMAAAGDDERLLHWAIAIEAVVSRQP